MKAMVLAAGLGTRLRPLTDTRPKALVEVAGRTLLEITLTRLHTFGVNEVIVNVHHFAGMVIAYLKAHHNFGMRIEVSREDDLLLDTGGGLKKAAWFFLEGSQAGGKQDLNKVTPSLPAQAERAGDLPSASEAKASSAPGNEHLSTARGKAFVLTGSASDSGAVSAQQPFLLHNVDVISDIDFRRMLEFHNERRALATLAVQSRASSRLLLFNENLQLVGRYRSAEKAAISSEAKNPGLATAPANSDQIPPPPLAFSGIHIISPRLLPALHEEGAFSIIDAYLRLAAQGEKILAFRADEYYWRDLGRPGDLSQAALDLQERAL